MRICQKWIVVVSIVVLMALLACATPAATSTAASATTVQPIVLKAAHWVPAIHPFSKTVESVLQDVEKKSNGKLKFELYPGEQLVKAKDQYLGVTAKRFDIAPIVMSSYNQGRFPITAVVELPFLITADSTEVSVKIISEAFSNSPAAQAEWGDSKAFGIFCTGAYALGTKNSVTTLSDVKGLKIKSMYGPIGEMLKALGCVPVDMASPEMYNAMQTGMLDGIAYIPASWPSFHLEEVAKYMLLPGMYRTVGMTFAMNTNSFNALPKDMQNLLSEEFSKANLEAARKAYDDLEKTAIETKIKPAGVTVNTLSKEELNKWMDIASPIHDAYINSLGDKSAGAREFYNAILKARDKYLGY